MPEGNVSISDLEQDPEDRAQELDDVIEAEYIIRNLTSPETEVMLLKFFGYDYGEIRGIMGLRRMSNVYRINRKLQKRVRFLIKNNEIGL